MKTAPTGVFGKYREIVLAVAFFLVFDLAVLVLNFYTSFQISEDAISINLSGRQRMLSQRMTKALLILQSDKRSGEVSDAAAELKTSATLFSATLEGFRSGGRVMGGDNKEVDLKAATSPGAQAVLTDAYAVWNPYLNTLKPVLDGDVSEEKLNAAVSTARASNLKLLKLMNALTTELEAVATAKADRLRMVQTGGIALALLNFAFILFKFIRKLRESDRQTEVAQKETSEILATVKDGLFLLDKDGNFGLLHSTSLESILRRPVNAGDDFMLILRGMMAEEQYESARDYVELLFGDRVRENLITSLNPMQEIRVSHRDEQGELSYYYLSFHFNRVLEDGQVAHLLVTVSDVTEKMRLASELESAKAEKRQEMEILLNLLKVHPDTMRRFLNDTEAALESINLGLRKGADSEEGLRPILDMAFRTMHRIKGNAAAAELDMFEDLAHDFELTLADLRRQVAPGGEAVLGLAVRLDEFFQRLTLIKRLFSRLEEHYGRGSGAQESEATELIKRVDQLAKRIAADQQKMVVVDASLPAFAGLPMEAKSTLAEIAIQFTRNAIVHGLESPEERKAMMKLGVGTLQIRCENLPDEGFEFVFRDDGRGLSPEKVKQTLIAKGIYNEPQLAEFSDKQLIMKLFEPGFSTLGTASHDAGHGFGLDVVNASIQKLGGRLTILSRPNAFTEFRIRFA